eukprot:scaffold9046_cov127-Isochrysis_galbana.AAC.3
MSISAYASDLSAASSSHSCEFTQSHPSPSSGIPRQLLSVIVLGVTLATKVPVGPSFLFPQASWSYA